MEQSSLQAIRAIVDPLKKWSPETIPFPSGEVDVDGELEFINLMTTSVLAAKRMVRSFGFKSVLSGTLMATQNLEQF